MKIVLTGGPSAGKTSIAELLSRAHWDRVTTVLEAATVIFRGGFPRGDHNDIKQRCQQRAIYFVQRELEELAWLDRGNRALICDRGSLDGLAYWPNSTEEFFAAVGSTMDRELARYDWVLHLDTAPVEGYQHTSLRIEDLKTAQVLNEKVKQVWSLHPRRLIIPPCKSFAHKAALTLEVVERILTQHSLAEVESFVNASIVTPSTRSSL